MDSPPPAQAKTTAKTKAKASVSQTSAATAIANQPLAQPFVGWREWVSFPQLGISRVKAKVDTGARTSSLHASNIKRFRRGGKSMVRFDVCPTQHSRKGLVTVEAPLVEMRSVRSSNGKAQVRPVIRTAVQLGDRQWELELTLTNRDAMGFRMLLGRQALRKRFLIDPGRSYIQGKQ